MKTPRIITITLNPSLDRSIVTHYLSTGYHNQTEEATRLDPSGAGLDISRALSKLSCDTKAIILLGNDATATAYKALVADEHFEITTITKPGPTRSNTIILDTWTHEETQITEPSANFQPSDLELVSKEIERSVEKGDFVVLAGLLPFGAPPDTYASLMRIARDNSASVAVIASGQVLTNALKEKPDLIVMTRLELEGYFNFPVREMDDIIACARKLQEKGAGKVLVEMRSKSNAILVSMDGVYDVSFHEADEGTSSGVWEALIAGYLAGRASQQPLETALALGAAAANFTASQVGHEFGSLREVRDLAMEGDQTSATEGDAEQNNDDG